MASSGGAFFKGGCGCLVVFFLIGFIAVALGGRMHIDAGGFICLFVCGGLLGLLVLAIYNMGVREGQDQNDDR
jgi:hypothetical protein